MRNYYDIFIQNLTKFTTNKLTEGTCKCWKEGYVRRNDYLVS